MGATQQPEPARSGTTGAEAAFELAEIERRQQQVIKTTLAPVWCWWVIAPAMVAIGAARDSHDPVVLAVTIPLAVLVMAGAVIASIPEVRRRVRVHSGAQPGGRGALALAGLIALVIAVTTAVAASLAASRVPHPLTIGYGAGAIVLVIGGPLLNRYLSRLMLAKASQHMTDAPRPRAPWRGVLSAEAGDHSPDRGVSASDGGAP